MEMAKSNFVKTPTALLDTRKISFGLPEIKEMLDRDFPEQPV
jgi:hypothetical protein